MACWPDDLVADRGVLKYEWVGPNGILPAPMPQIINVPNSTGTQIKQINLGRMGTSWT